MLPPGRTGRATSRELGRRLIGCDVDPDAVKAARIRLADAAKGPPHQPLAGLAVQRSNLNTDPASPRNYPGTPGTPPTASTRPPPHLHERRGQGVVVEVLAELVAGAVEVLAGLVVVGVEEVGAVELLADEPGALDVGEVGPGGLVVAGARPMRCWIGLPPP